MIVIPLTGVTRLAQISVTSALYLASQLDVIFRGTVLVVGAETVAGGRQIRIKGITKLK